MPKKSEKPNGNGAHGRQPEPIIATTLNHYEKLKTLLDKAISQDEDDDTRRTSWIDFNQIWGDQSFIERNELAPVIQENEENQDTLTKFKIEHDFISLLVCEINSRPFLSELASVEMNFLKNLLDNRSANFSETGDGVLKQARKAGVDFSKLEREERRQPTGEAKRLVLWLLNGNSRMETQDMRMRGRERDDYGRFMPEHDDDRRAHMTRGGRYPDRDEHGRFISDDDDDRRSRSSRSASQYRDRDEQGRFVSEDDDRYGRHSPRSRYDDEDDYRRSRSARHDYDERRRPGGWYGDSEGHSQAARRGWDDRDHGPSGWYGDSEGHSRAARRGWDNPDHGPSGWYGDSEGHSRAAQRGWDDRQPSRDYYDDDRRRGPYRRRD